MKKSYLALCILGAAPLLGEPTLPSFYSEPLEKITPPSSVFLPHYKSPKMAVLLSSLYPGLGHRYLGDKNTAVSLFASVANKNNKGDRSPFAKLLQGEHAWFYNVYAAYRDARVYIHDMDYLYSMPSESLEDLATAPFRWSVIKKPEVWGGFLGALTVATGMQFLHAHAAISTSSISPLRALPVGIGEEAFFRGFLQPELSESLGPWGGIFASSALFGAAHIPNAHNLGSKDRAKYYKSSVPYITAFGVYFGWVAKKNRSLKECVALHSWYDFTLFALSAAAQTAVIGEPSFTFELSF